MARFPEAHLDLKALFPDLPDDQLLDVEETLRGYCATAWRIYERLERECPEVIDEFLKDRTMKVKVDSPHTSPINKHD
jgi:hypothetical protein